ncbi:MAG: CDGSH iron-sulfur domain-containing protein [Planctomycetota bacterium]|nr:CDGSH iron-sulfur domain-containing protein [Planctomycetota bacterium]
MVIDIEEAQTIAWCGCKRTCNAPFCDGSHSQLS